MFNRDWSPTTFDNINQGGSGFCIQVCEERWDFRKYKKYKYNGSFFLNFSCDCPYFSNTILYNMERCVPYKSTGVEEFGF